MSEPTRRSLEISIPALAELVLLITPAGTVLVGAAAVEPEEADDTTGVTGAAAIVMGILTLV